MAAFQRTLFLRTSPDSTAHTVVEISGSSSMLWPNAGQWTLHGGLSIPSTGSPPASDGRAGFGRAAEILALGESCGGHPAPRRPAGDNIARATSSGSYGAGPGYDPGLDNVVVGALTASRTGRTGERRGRDPLVWVVRTAQTGANGWGVNENTAHTLDGAQGQAVVVTYGGNHQSGPIEIATALTTRSRLDFESETFLTVSLDGTSQYGVQSGASVRRLTPVECERLQGFPDGWTHGKDGPRYRALGNAVTVPVAEWLGQRIMAAARQEDHAAGEIPP
jgi:DNA (cytosine-5)-methyltransferase 1